MTLTWTQTLMAIDIENKTSNKTFHPFTGNFCSSLLSVVNFFLRLMSPFVIVTWFFYNVNKNTVKLPWVFGAGGHKIILTVGLFPTEFGLFLRNFSVEFVVYRFFQNIYFGYKWDVRLELFQQFKSDYVQLLKCLVFSKNFSFYIPYQA